MPCLAEIKEVNFMKIVFEGNKNRVNAMSNCGCACYPSIGAIGNNKPSLQVAHYIRAKIGREDIYICLFSDGR